MKQVLAVRGSPDHFRPEESLPYEEALRAAGIEPVLISPESAIGASGKIVGLLLMGGSDVNPALYGETRQPETQDPDDARDAIECALIQSALLADIPVLAICRGIQILNVQHGGTLVQHLDSSARHRVRTENRGQPAHPVEIVPGTRLAEIFGNSRTIEVNSRHHQAIARLGEGLRISARDPEDGTIEAVEREDKHFVVGVEWHPENMSPTDTRQAKLFEAFAASLTAEHGSLEIAMKTR
jgi:putative glutamine amidotransferase